MNLKALRFHANIPRYLFTRFFGKFSKSVYYRGFPPLKLDEVEEPQVKPNWVKIRTVYTGICGSDINMISLKGYHIPKDAVLYAAYFYLRYTVSYRDLEEIMTEHSVKADHATLNR